MSEFVVGPSSCSLNYKHDMFLSFRGDDDRYIFTSSFLKTLKGANIAILVDDQTIKTPEDLKPELGIGIKESRASIIVLPKNYTSWILILEEAHPYQEARIYILENLKRRLETEFIKEIVQDIHYRLQVLLRSAVPQLIGRYNSIKFVT
uniref:TIR domain-containing protein n=1 Tax=Lactuca sativa TaxID=4236 RepID=A0A9R1WN21_LACSA|nr:hypothetical protein LSAT_V11C100031980 [Lactuca sativa]